jgi:hypothetical protein
VKHRALLCDSYYPSKQEPVRGVWCDLLPLPTEDPEMSGWLGQRVVAQAACLRDDERGDGVVVAELGDGAVYVRLDTGDVLACGESVLVSPVPVQVSTEEES